MRVAAIQQEPVIGDIAANLAACEKLAEEAGTAGAEIIVLPEFFTSGMGFAPALADASLPFDGPATRLLQAVSRRFSALVGGSFLCRDSDGEVRNAFVVAREGIVVGRHDKDTPTMWENCFYVGGSDDGIVALDGLDLGAVLCLEFNRTGTARRLRGRVDLIVGGSFVWSVPEFLPGPAFRRLEERMDTIDRSRPRLARMVGAPVVEATHCGRLDSAVPWAPGLRYRTRLWGGAQILDAAGAVVGRREPEAGPGIVIADVAVGRAAPVEPLLDSYWIEPMGPVGELLWRYQRIHGRRWYRRHVGPATR